MAHHRDMIMPIPDAGGDLCSRLCHVTVGGIPEIPQVSQRFCSLLYERLGTFDTDQMVVFRSLQNSEVFPVNGFHLVGMRYCATVRFGDMDVGERGASRAGITEWLTIPCHVIEVRKQLDGRVIYTLNGCCRFRYGVDEVCLSVVEWLNCYRDPMRRGDVADNPGGVVKLPHRLVVRPAVGNRACASASEDDDVSSKLGSP